MSKEVEERLMAKFISFLTRPPIKNTIIALLGFLESISIALLGDLSWKQPHFVHKTVFLVVITALNLIAIIVFTTKEVNQRRAIAELKRQNTNYENLVMSLNVICSTNSDEINECIHRVYANSTIDLGLWSFEKACRAICLCIFNNIKSFSSNSGYEVAYIKLIEDRFEQDSVKMVAYANPTHSKPKIFNKVRSFKDIDTDSAYHDLILFNQGNSNLSIGMGVNEVDEMFIHNKKHYHMYIGIPVFCNDTKMIGLLEIVGCDDSMLGCLTKAELEDFTNKFLVPYAKMLLLLHKMEKALLAGT